jgi:RNA polymerase sigma-70 factor (ECF subfamily)
MYRLIGAAGTVAGDMVTPKYTGGGAMDSIDSSRYINELYAYAMVLTRNPAEAEDLVQETYVRGLKAMGSLRVDSSVKSWLFTILRNIWLNQLRGRRNGPEMIEVDVDASTANIAVETPKDPHALYLSKMEHEQVREAIEQLPVEFREVILLREYEELSYQEIASVLGCPAGTVMSRLGRARSKLRTLLSAALEARPTHEDERPENCRAWR